MNYILGAYSALFLFVITGCAMEVTLDSPLEEIGVQVLTKLSKQRSVCYPLFKKIEHDKRAPAFKVPQLVRDKNKKAKRDSNSSELKVYSKQPTQLLPKPLCINGQYMIFRSSHDNKVYLISIATGDFLHTFAESQELIKAARFTSTNEIIITLTSGKEQIWTINPIALSKNKKADYC